MQTRCYASIYQLQPSRAAQQHGSTGRQSSDVGTGHVRRSPISNADATGRPKLRCAPAMPPATALEISLSSRILRCKAAKEGKDITVEGGQSPKSALGASQVLLALPNTRNCRQPQLLPAVAYGALSQRGSASGRCTTKPRSQHSCMTAHGHRSHKNPSLTLNASISMPLERSPREVGALLAPARRWRRLGSFTVMHKR